MLAVGSLFKAFGSMPSLLDLYSLIGMSMISKLFTKRKDIEVDSSTRQNGAFGNLTNTIQSGTPIPLVYGQFRVAGQMISGYIESEDHGKNDVVKARDKFDGQKLLKTPLLSLLSAVRKVVKAAEVEEPLKTQTHCSPQTLFLLPLLSERVQCIVLIPTVLKILKSKIM